MADLLGPERPELNRRRRKQEVIRIQDIDTPLAETELSLRLINALEKQNITTVEELGCLSNQQIKQIVKRGRHNNEEIQTLLRKHKLRF